MDTRPSPIVGRWYSAHPPSLTQLVDGYLEAATGFTPTGPMLGLVAPHAGHQYSGPVAGYAFAPLRGQTVDTVAILSPSHYHDDGALLTSGHAAYATPLGAVEVNPSAIAALRAALAHALDLPEKHTLIPIRNDREHAIEIELPFLQRVLPAGFTLIPVMIRDQSAAIMESLGRALAAILANGRVLIIASSDLSHFQSQAAALKFDALMLQQIDAFDPDGVLAAEEAAQVKFGLGLACGYGAIAATLWAARALGATRAQVVRHATSGDVSGDYSGVVGYGAAVIWKA